MLALPDVGMQRSVNSHNIKFDVLCDWIEGSILFDENKNAFSVMDVTDVLVDSGIYDDQDFAMQIVGDAWRELGCRLNRITPMKPFSITYPRVEPRIDSWEDVPAYSFCVLLSLGRCYQNWIEFVNSPQRAFAIPFALSKDDFRKYCVLIQGLFLDRCRLLAAARYCEQWESSALKDRILKWAQPRVQRLMFV